MHSVATVFQKLCYTNKDQLSAGIIVAGWDKEVGPSVYNIPVGGGLFRQPWAIGGLFLYAQTFTASTKFHTLGSGSTYVYGYCDATYNPKFTKQQTIDFVRNSEYYYCES